MTQGLQTKTWPESLERVFSVNTSDGSGAQVGYRHARGGDLVDSYPAGTHDLELFVNGHADPAALHELTKQILTDRPQCRRIVLAVTEGHLESIDWAEQAGYRYVVDVETAEGAFSLLVTEPDWVIEQPAILEDIPLDK